MKSFNSRIAKRASVETGRSNGLSNPGDVETGHLKSNEKPRLTTQRGSVAGYLYPAVAGCEPIREDWHTQYVDNVHNWSVDYDRVPKYARLRGWTRVEICEDGTGIRIHTLDGYRINSQLYSQFKIGEARRSYFRHLQRTLFRVSLLHCPLTGEPLLPTARASTISDEKWSKKTGKDKRSIKRKRRSAKEARSLIDYPLGSEQSWFSDQYNAFVARRLHNVLDKKVRDTFSIPSDAEIGAARAFMSKAKRKFPRANLSTVNRGVQVTVERFMERLLICKTLYKACWQHQEGKLKFQKSMFLALAMDMYHFAYPDSSVCELIKSSFASAIASFETHITFKDLGMPDYDPEGEESYDDYNARCEAYLDRLVGSGSPTHSEQADMPDLRTSKEREFVAPLFFLSCIPFLRLKSKDKTQTWFANAVHNYSSVGGACDAKNILESVFGWCRWLLETGMEAFEKKDLSVFWTKHSSYIDWYRTSTALIQKETVIGMDGSSEEIREYAEDLVEASLKGINLMKLAIASKSTSLPTIARVLDKIDTIIAAEFVQSVVRGPRPVPKGIQLPGPSGIGKSHMILQLAAMVSSIFGHTFSAQDVYTRNIQDKFWSGWRTRFRYILYEDIGAIHHDANPQAAAAAAEEICQVIGPNPYSPNMADLHEKGRVVCRPYAVFATSNVEDLGLSQAAATLPAVFNRFNIKVELFVKDQYRMTNPLLNPTDPGYLLDALDPELIDDEGRENGIHWITVRKYRNVTGDPRSKAYKNDEVFFILNDYDGSRLERVSTPVFFRWFAKFMTKHKETSDRSNKARERAVAVELCPIHHIKRVWCECAVEPLSGPESDPSLDPPTDVESGDDKSQGPAEDIDSYEVPLLTRNKRKPLKPFVPDREIREKFAENSEAFTRMDGSSLFQTFPNYGPDTDDDASDGPVHIGFAQPDDDSADGFESDALEYFQDLDEFRDMEPLHGATSEQGWFGTSTSRRAWKVRTKGEVAFKRFVGGIDKMRNAAYTGYQDHRISEWLETINSQVQGPIGSIAILFSLAQMLKGPSTSQKMQGLKEDEKLTKLEEKVNRIKFVPDNETKGKNEQMDESDPIVDELRAIAASRPDVKYRPPETSRSKLVLSTGHGGVSMESLLRMVEANTYTLEVFGNSNTVVGRVQGTFIKEFTFMTVWHVLYDQDKKPRGGAIRIKQRNSTYMFKFSDLDVREDFDHDIAFINFPAKSLRKHKDLTSYLPVEHNPIGATYQGIYSVLEFDREKCKVGDMRRYPVVGHDCVGKFNDEHVDRCSRKRFISETRDLGVGSCGALLVVKEGSKHFIGVIHQAGSPTDGQNVGTFLSRELLWAKPTRAMLVSQYVPDFANKGLGPGPDVKFSNVYPQHAYHLHHELPSHITPIGSIQGKRGSTKSRFYKTPMCDKVAGLPRNEFEAPDFKIYTHMSKGELAYHCHLTKAMDQMANTGKFTIEELQPAADVIREFLFCQYDKIVPAQKLTPMSIDLALNGTDVRFFESVKASTSMGLPGMGTKEPYIPQDPITGRRSMTKPTLAAFRKFVRSLGDGKSPPILINLTLKDCKTKNDKVRAFACMPWFYNLLVKMLLAPLLNIMHMFPEMFGNAVGMNVRSSQWRMVYNHLDAMIYQFCLDYSKFDKGAPFEANYHVWCLIIAVYERYCDLSYTIFDVPAIVLLYECARLGLNPLYVLREVVYLVRGSNPSGNAWTVDWNFLLNLLYMCSAFLAHPKSKDYEFTEVVRWFIYGDDNNSGTKVEWFNLVYLEEYLGKHNIKVTMATKGDQITKFQPLSEQTFLKRRFADWGGRMHAPLMMESIAAMINCGMESKTQPRSSVERTNIGGALEELCEWEPTDEVLALDAEIRKCAVAIYGPTCVYPTREETLARWSKDYGEVPDVHQRGKRRKTIEGQGPVDIIGTSNGFDVPPAPFDSEKRKPKSQRVVIDVARDLQKQSDQTELNNTEATNDAILIHSSDPIDTSRPMAEAGDGQISQPQVTQIETIAPIATIDIEKASIETSLAPAPVDAGLESYLSRPIKLQEFAWNSDINVKFDPWQLLFSQSRVRNKLQGYKFIRANLHLVFQTNGTPFHAGRLLVSYEPRQQGIAHSAIGDYRQHSTQPCAYIDPMKSNVIELPCPFISTDLFMDLGDQYGVQVGVVHIDTVCPLFMANSSTNVPVNINVMGWLTDVELAMPTDAAMANFIAQSDEYSTSPNSGVISGPSTAIASFASRLTEIPFIGRFARATEIGGNAVAGIASMFGYSRPLMIGAPEERRVVKVGRMATTDTPDNSAKLTVSSKQEVTIDPGVIGMGNSKDELSISEIVSKHCIVHTHTVASTASSGTTVFDHPISPMFGETTSVVTGGTAYYMTPMSYLMRMFQYWTGTIEVKITVVASAYHRGRLRVSWYPEVGGSAGNDYNALYSQIIDLSGSRAYTFNIPFCSKAGYHDRYTPNGRLVCKVLNEIVAPIDPSQVCLLVSVAGGPDFEYAVPDGDISHFSHIVAQADGDYTIDEEVVPVNFFEGGKGPGRNVTYMGETIASLRPLLKRYARYTNFAPESYPIAGQDQIYNFRHKHYPQPRGFTELGSWITTGVSNPPDTRIDQVATCAMSYLSPAFHARKGSVRYMLRVTDINDDYISNIVVRREKLDAPQNQTMGVTATAHADWSNLNLGGWSSREIGPATHSRDLDRELEGCLRGSQLVSNKRGLALQYESPYYNPKRFHLSLGDLDPNNLAVHPDDQEKFGAIGGDFKVFNELQGNQDTGSSLPILKLYVAAGEDFTFHFWTGVPVMYIQESGALLSEYYA